MEPFALIYICGLARVALCKAVPIHWVFCSLADHVTPGFLAQGHPALAAVACYLHASTAKNRGHRCLSREPLRGASKYTLCITLCCLMLPLQSKASEQLRQVPFDTPDSATSYVSAFCLDMTTMCYNKMLHASTAGSQLIPPCVDTSRTPWPLPSMLRKHGCDRAKRQRCSMLPCTRALYPEGPKKGGSGLGQKHPVCHQAIRSPSLHPL